MAQLESPGVSVSVINESFYTPAAPGTVSLIVVATASNKKNSSGTGVAKGTLKSDAGTVHLLTSQADLGATFGDPIFEVDTGSNPVNGGELNEYGLQAAYSLLGVSASAFVVRADLDLNQLKGVADEPVSKPANGTYWFDTANSLFGIYEWDNGPVTATNGQTFVNKVPRVITATSQVVTGGTEPKRSVGAIGDYAIVAVTSDISLYYKNASGTWVLVGTPDWAASWPTVASGAFATSGISGKTFYINSTKVTIAGSDTVDAVVTGINNANISGVTAAKVNNRLQIFLNETIDSININLGGDGSVVLADIGLTTGEFYGPKLTIAPHTQVPTYKSRDAQPRPKGSLWIKTTQNNLGAHLYTKRFNSTTALFETVPAPIYATTHSALKGLDLAGGGINLPVGAVFVKSNATEEAPIKAIFKLYRRSASGATNITSRIIAANTFAAATSYTFQMAESLLGQDAFSASKSITFTADGTSFDADTVAGRINSAGFVNVTASVDNLNRVVISHKLGGDFTLTNGNNSPLTSLGFAVIGANATANLYDSDDASQYTATLWKPLSYTAGSKPPSSLTADGTYWYSSVHDEVDIMIHNGTKWVGYKDATNPFYSNGTDPAGPIVSATQPLLQSTGTPLQTGDLWIDTRNEEKWGTVYKYNRDLVKWILINKADHDTEEGIIFADARYSDNGVDSYSASISELLVSNYVDFDCPDPALYPKGMLLWNLRRSGFNVKQFKQNYIDTTKGNIRYNNETMGSYYPHRWVTVSTNQDEDGSGSFGRQAQRKVVEIALKATVNSNQEIRDEESRVFNLIACPGYPELISAMIGLNYDRGLTAFVIGDTPCRLPADATSLLSWGMNSKLALQDNDRGAVSYDEYMAMFYPWGFTSDNFGRNIVVPPSHMILRTIALSDQVSYPWFAPAGVRRGGITNASAVGYVNADGQFVSVALNTGQRDTLYKAEINPITFLTGTGLVNYGQKTRAKGTSALDRINVARLVCYLRRQLNRLAKPYIFEPNDKITRDQIKAAAESLMLELVGNRALYDYVVVCDTSNNTPSRIDRNELYLDIAIEPVKAVEYIYIPLRLENTGAIKALGIK